jgi:hypothetical protein
MAVTGATVQVKDFRLFMAALAATDRKTQRVAREEIRKAGDHVKADAATRMASVDGKSAAGYRTRVRQRGVAVEQSIRKSPAVTRRRPNFGALQMSRALLPALDANEQNTVAALERALDTVCDQFNRGGVVV